ncbi:MAG TPA: SGNH/GDSL hydrolase family protein [Kiritimatiellia bacterium]|nr:SGNH/GDSL hydrolase family protein [Kiritimatiellia bacterium]
MNKPFILSVRIASVMGSLALACTQANGEVSRSEGRGLNVSTLAGVRKILFLGNSITLHGPNPSIGWTNNWGMAASAQAKDYVHVVQSAVAELTGAVPDIMFRNIATFEQNYTNYNVETSLADAFAFAPDLFVLAIGENVPAFTSEEQKTQFKNGVARIINGVRTHSRPIVVVRSCFWASATKDLALSQVSRQAGALFVNIGALGADESNYARSERYYENAGVGAHPGDKGMSEIANAILQALLSQELGVADNFEYVGEGYGTTNGYVNMPIGAYKCQPYGESSGFTNHLWHAEANDFSKLVADTSAYAGSVRPLAGSTAALALNVDTGGKTLVRTANNQAAFDFSASPIYLDTLVKFTPSADPPTISDPTVKAAVFMDTNLHLWVCHGVGGAGQNITNSDTGLVISTNDWHRLTIMLGKLSGSAGYAFKIYVDQAAVSCAAGMNDLAVSPGPWFWSAANDASFKEVAFKGRGMLDELVVTEAEPDLGLSAILLTLSFDSAQVLVSTNGVSVHNNDLVPNGSQIAINARPWHEITSGGALFTGGDTTNTVEGTTMITAINGTVAGAGGETNTIVSSAYRQTAAIATGLGCAAPADKIAAWAIKNSLTTLDSDMLDDYLMNVDAGTNPSLFIDSITVAGTDATIVIKATGGVDLQTINGVVNVWTTADLTEAFVSSGPAYITATTGTQMTVVVPRAADTFIKATVDVIDQAP